MADGLMRLLIFIGLLSLSLNADMLKKKTLACPSVLLLQKAMKVDLTDPLELEMYSIANGCAILSRSDKVEALGYDPRNAKDIYQKIYYKKTNSQLYLLRSAITVEQGGKKNRVRF